MTNKTIFKKGYTLRVLTWENDADNYNTCDYWIGETEKVIAEQYIEFLRLFKSSSKNGIGNIYEPRDGDLERVDRTIKEFLNSHPDFVADLGYFHKEGWNCEDQDAFIDCINEDFLYAVGLTAGEFYYRVFESAELIYAPENIELETETYR